MNTTAVETPPVGEDEVLRQQLIQDWKDHTKKPLMVRERLMDRLAIPMGDTALIELSALGVHLFGEHMGDWAAGLDYLRQLEATHSDVSSEAKHRLKRQETLLKKAVDTGFSLSELNETDQLYVTALSVPAVTLQKSAEEGLQLFRESDALMEAIDTIEARRLVAVMTANLVCDLLERYELSTAGRNLLVMLAEKSFALWSRDGNEEDRERAAFRLMQSYQACRKPQGFGSGRYPRYLWIEP